MEGSLNDFLKKGRGLIVYVHCSLFSVQYNKDPSWSMYRYKDKFILRLDLEFLKVYILKSIQWKQIFLSCSTNLFVSYR